MSILCCHTFGQTLFLALSNNPKCKVLMYDLETNTIIGSFKSYNDEHVLDMFAYSTQRSEYLFVATLTACICYRLTDRCKVEQICAYYVNAKKKQNKKAKSTNA